MKKVVLISCASQKLTYKAKAKSLYISPLFRKSLKYAIKLRPDAIFILSARSGLLGLEEEIEPYELTLNRMPVEETRKWAERVVRQLSERADLENDQFIILAGAKYRKHLIPHLRSYEVPLEGLPIGKQLQYLNQAGAR